MNEYTCIVKLEFGGNFVEAKNEEEYLEKVKDIFFEEYNLEIDGSEIFDVQEHLKAHVNQDKNNTIKTKWVSVPIKRVEFLERGHTQEEWKEYKKNIPTKGIVYVRREIEIKENA